MEEQLLAAWNIHDRVDLYLLDAIVPETLHGTSASRGLRETPLTRRAGMGYVHHLLLAGRGGMAERGEILSHLTSITQ